MSPSGGLEANLQMAEHKLLVVDDDPAVQKALKRLLEANGYAVTACGSGAEALRLCRAGEFRAAFVDYKMPEMT